MPGTTTTLRGISEIRSYFGTNQTPVYFVSPPAFNLLGIDRWLRNFFNVNYFDSFEGNHPARLPAAGAAVPRVRVDGGDLHLPLAPQGGARPREAQRAGGEGVFVMFDDETEAAAASSTRGCPLPRAAPSG